ncbi:MAG: hypothetical protein RLZZ450_7715 [Pseudomonadota bacterium]|jgi:hypothetical protein
MIQLFAAHAVRLGRDAVVLMPGRRGANFRSGDRAEGLAAEMMRAFAAVVPIPRTEDVGIEFFATLLHRRGPLLDAGETFAVQTKSASVSELTFNQHQYGWLCSQTQVSPFMRHA